MRSAAVIRSSLCGSRFACMCVQGREKMGSWATAAPQTRLFQWLCLEGFPSRMLQPQMLSFTACKPMAQLGPGVSTTVACNA
jgi:hypothetical protein